MWSELQLCCRTVKKFSIDGALKQTWRLQRINDMVLTPDGQAILYIAVDKKINVLRLHEDREVRPLPPHRHIQDFIDHMRPSLQL